MQIINTIPRSHDAASAPVLHAWYRASFLVNHSLITSPARLLLRRALDTLGTRVHVIVILVRASHASCAGLLPCGVDSLECEVFGHGVRGRCGIRSLSWRQNGLEGADVLGCQRCAVFAAETLRELDVELDVQVAVVVVPVRRHTLTADDLDLARGNALTRNDVDSQPPLVEVLNVDLSTGEGGQEIDFAVEEKVVALALETWVGLLLDLKDDIARLDARKLVAFAAELDLVTALDTTVNVYVENLALDDGLLAVALLAPVLIADDLALSLAVGADSLESLDHGAHLPHHVLHTAAIAAGALLDSTLLTTDTVALRADNGLLESKLGDLAAVDVLERDLVGVGDRARLLRTLLAHTTAEHASKWTSTTTAEELSEQILGSHAVTAHATLLETLLAILVVQLSFLRILENFVCV
jgi:hypothetical protein